MHILPIFLLVLSTTQATAKEGKELFEPTVGVAVTVPDNWAVVASSSQLFAVSDDRKAFVYLLASEKDFEDEAVGIEAALKRRLDRVKVEEALILMEDDRGSLSGAVAVKGTAIDRKDGSAVTFAGMLVRSGKKGALALGAWKDTAHAEAVRAIIDGVRVKQPRPDQGLELRDVKSGASVKLPKGWDVFSYRKGLITLSPDRAGFALIMAPRANFAIKRAIVRGILTEHVFKDVKIDEFASIAEIDSRGFKEVRAVTGTAKDRVDNKPVEFMAVAAELAEGDEDRGILIVGAWKDKAHMKAIQSLLKSLRLRE